MARFEFRLPDIGEGIAEGEVVAWHVTPGQQVVEDQEMVEVMTDKATVTIGVPRKGRIAQLNATIGERVKVGSVLVVIEDSAGEAEPERPERGAAPLSPVEARGAARELTQEARASAREQLQAARDSSREQRPSRIPAGGDADAGRSRFPTPAARPLTPAQARGRERALRPVRTAEEPPRSLPAAQSASVVASAVGDIREDLPGADFFGSRPDPRGSTLARGMRPPAAVPVEAPSAGEFFAPKPLATPATRKLARDLGVDLRRVSPSGPRGRVTKDDVRSSRPDRAPRTGSGTALPREERKPFVGLRRRIAERMQLARHKAAHFTFVEEVEVDSLMALLQRVRPAAERAQAKLNYLPFIVKAATLALQKHPILNSMLDEASSELVYRRYYHIGVATATQQGLVVPVVRDADQKSVLAIAKEIERLAEGARQGRLSAGELSGSTFTVSSLGKQGGLLATPVLNYPEVGILGVHRVKQRPVVRDGQIVVGHVMHLSLSLDHRVVDGHVGAAFAYELIAYLEQPELLLLELS